MLMNFKILSVSHLRERSAVFSRGDNCLNNSHSNTYSTSLLLEDNKESFCLKLSIKQSKIKRKSQLLQFHTIFYIATLQYKKIVFTSTFLTESFMFNTFVIQEHNHRIDADCKCICNLIVVKLWSMKFASPG